MRKGIWVAGHGRAVGPRDECSVTVGSDVRAATAADALAESSRVLERMRTALRAAGVDAAALATSAVSLAPVYDDYPTVAGFSASVQLTATTRDLAAVGPMLSSVVAAGGDAARLHDVTYRHSDPSALLARAREAAWADALARASQLAVLAGRTLGEVVCVEEATGAGRPPAPMRLAAAEVVGAPDVPLDPGEGQVSVSVTARWALR